jgi:hypothetical protein
MEGERGDSENVSAREKKYIEHRPGKAHFPRNETLDSVSTLTRCIKNQIEKCE